MKPTYRKIFYSIALASLLASCNGYLDSSSADLQIPKSVDDYAPLLLGEGYPNTIGSELSFAELMTDDVEMGPLYYTEEQLADGDNFSLIEGVDQSTGYGTYAHSWARDYSQYLSDGYWDARYHNILACNSIIDALPDMANREEEADLYRKLAFQAYALRAFNYFCLINTYAKPYSKENLNEPGVVLKNEAELGIKGTGRATIGEVYKQIDDDLAKAEEYVVGANAKASKYEFPRAGVYFLASRVALFEQNWDKVIEEGEKFLKMNKSIFDLNTVDESTFGLVTSSSGDGSYFANDCNADEVVWSFGKNDSYSNAHTYLSGHSSWWNYEVGLHVSWDGDNSLIKLYDSDDLRLKAYYTIPYAKEGSWIVEYTNGQYYPHKCTTNFTNDRYTSQAWRVPEVYLNMAEAYARKGNAAQAVECLNTVRVKKYRTGSDKATVSASDFATTDDLVKFIWDERRRELSFQENIRFWDMRRQGMPAQTHRVYTSKNDYTTYDLPQGSANYVLQIPESETNYNDNVKNNQRENIVGK